MKQTQKERRIEAKKISWKFHCWLGYMVCDSVEDELSLRKLVKKIQRDAIKEFIIPYKIKNLKNERL